MSFEVIKEFLSNSIIIDWIAPIITTLIATLVVSGIKIFIQDEKNKKDIKLANDKILDTIRPFIIQQIPISKDVIISIVDSIRVEKNIKEKDIYTFEEIKNKLIFDIADTRFLKENDKNRHFKLINKIFDSSEKECINIEQEKIIEKDSQINENNSNDFGIIYIVAICLMYVCMLLSDKHVFFGYFALIILGVIICFVVTWVLREFFSFLFLIGEIIISFFIKDDKNS